MARALQLAAKGSNTSFPNPRVGCVIAKNGEVLAEGWHVRAGESHAEVLALQQAGDKTKGADVYVTLEPCSHFGRTPPCADALIAAGVARVWVAMRDPNPQVAGAGIARLRAAGIAVEVGLLQAQAAALNRGFVSRMRRRRPFVSVKLGASLDGRTAMASGESQWITSQPSRADVHRRRASAGAVLTSAKTVMDDDPQLTVRLPDVVCERQPDRIVLDRAARLGADAAVWKQGARRFWVTAQAGDAFVGVTRLAAEATEQGFDLENVLRQLADQQINEVMVEAGAGLSGAFVQAGLADEVLIYMAPCLLGHEAQAMALLPGLEHLRQRVELVFSDIRQLGPDLRILATPKISTVD